MPLSHAVDPTAFIAAALTPAIALSACAFLTSNAQTKYSALVDRLRALNAERREFQLSAKSRGSLDTNRLESLERQIALIFRRSRHLRDAIFLLSLAMMAVILTSFLIAALEYFHLMILALLPKWTFIAGLLFVLFALIEELLEVRLTFRVVRYELGLFDEKNTRHIERLYKSI